MAILIRQVLRLAKAGTQDEKGVLQLALKQTEMAGIRPAAGGGVGKAAAGNALLQTVAKAWRVAKRTKDERTATQLLSLLVVQPLHDAQVSPARHTPAALRPSLALSSQGASPSPVHATRIAHHHASRPLARGCRRDRFRRCALKPWSSSLGHRCACGRHRAQTAASRATPRWRP